MSLRRMFGRKKTLKLKKDLARQLREATRENDEPRIAVLKAMMTPDEIERALSR